MKILKSLQYLLPGTQHPKASHGPNLSLISSQYTLYHLLSYHPVLQKCHHVPKMRLLDSFNVFNFEEMNRYVR